MNPPRPTPVHTDPLAHGDSVERFLDQARADRIKSHLHRRRVIVHPIDSVQLEIDGKRFVNFSSNNYLGLTHHPAVIAALTRIAQTHGAGSAASPSISGHTSAHESAERALAKWKGTEAAVLLPSGYQANHAAIQTIAGGAKATATRVRFLLDKLVHASLIDATRGSGLPLRVFPHNDLTKLRRLLSDADPSEAQIVITESIFSMDGDAADLEGLAALKRDHPFTLLLDEAHASGVYGDAGAGYAAERGLSSIVDLFIVTLSKGLGVAGGAICASNTFCDAVANFGRAFIYSTAIAPALAGACEAAIQVLRDEPARQTRVRQLARRVRDRLTQIGHQFPSGDSPIIPIIVGAEQAALQAAARLRKAGLLVLALRPPTVARGTSRLRITLSCEHTDDQVERLLQALKWTTA